MKKFFIFCFILFSFVLYAENLQYYTVKSGKVEYELSGNISGNKTMWFDDFGRKKRIELNKTTTVKIFGIESVTTEKTMTIFDGEYIYSIDYQDNSGYKQPMPELANMANIEEMNEAEKQAFYDQTLADLGGKKLGKEKFLGRDCDVISLMGSKSWIYQGVTLKNETSLLGITNNETAIDFQENIKISADKFVPPTDIDWVENQVNQEIFYDGAYEEDEVYDDDFNNSKPGMSFDAFSKAVKSASIDGYNLANVENEIYEYKAIYMQSMFNSILVGASYIEPGMLEKSEDINKESKFSYKGKDAYYTTTPEGISVMYVIYPKYKTLISVLKMKDASKEDLIKILDSIKF